MVSAAIKNCVKRRALTIYEDAENHSLGVIEKAGKAIDSYFRDNKIDPIDLCFVVVGSVGRREALGASDLDIIPIARTEESLALFRPHDMTLRAHLKTALGLKVSKGQDLTKSASISSLTEPDSIGGNRDDSAALTKRLLILTESAQVGGALSLESVRESILRAYANEERTSGRHVLSLCNDISRYYKTLCIEYKAKVDEENKDWCTRNIKLRHSRKLWYFSNIIAIIHLAEQNPLGEGEFFKNLLGLFAEPPAERLAAALTSSHPIELGALLESFAMFMGFMAKPEHREALAKVEHDDRYEPEISNPFLSMKFNSDLLHEHMLKIIEGLGPARRERIMTWFLL